MPHPAWKPKTRPWCCPEPTCEPFAQMSENPDLSKPVMGSSWWCLGKMAQPRTFVYDGVQHTNDLNDCHYSPLKGVVRWEENADDIGSLASTYAVAFRRLEDEQAAERRRESE